MPNLRKYLRQTVTLRRPTDELNDSGEPVYSEPETARARKVSADGRTVNALGVVVDNRTKLLMDVEVSVGVLVDDVAIQGVEAMVDKRGKTLGYRVEL